MRLLPRTLTFIVLPIFCQPLSAGLILQPTAVVTNMGQFSSSYPKERVIDKSGLSSTYTSQVTDFDFYIASSPTHSSFTGAGIRWASSSGTPGTPTGNFDFNLGGEFTIESMALWNWGGTLSGQQSQGIQAFTLLADVNADFSSPTTFGPFTATRNNVGALPVEVFAFAPTQATHVRLEIGPNNPVDGNHGSTSFTSFAEVAFETTTSSIPEPSALLVIPLAALFLCGVSQIPKLRRGRHIDSRGKVS